MDFILEVNNLRAYQSISTRLGDKETHVRKHLDHQICDNSRRVRKVRKKYGGEALTFPPPKKKH